MGVGPPLVGAQRSLRSMGDQVLADSKLKDLIRLADTFGFYLMALDVRQESVVHSEVRTKGFCFSSFLTPPLFFFFFFFFFF